MGGRVGIIAPELINGIDRGAEWIGFPFWRYAEPLKVVPGANGLYCFARFV